MIKLILFKFNYWSILLIFILCSNLFASKWIYQADILNAQTTNKNEIKELSGNVIISKDDIILQTNRAVLYSKNDLLELFGDIVYDEINKGGLLLEDMEQLNEFQMFDRLARKVKGVSNQIKMQVKKIFDAIMKRMNQAFSYIKGLGEKVMEGLLAFFGLPINNVIVKGFKLVNMIIHHIIINYF